MDSDLLIRIQTDSRCEESIKSAKKKPVPVCKILNPIKCVTDYQEDTNEHPFLPFRQ
ncbi:hypothetical protein SBDP2_1130003 [Syntrophobacter sp. SbD2]|nr:hypothetical protein SBDP2_1130003 [Syntrophobacter sp. SbD2]